MSSEDNLDTESGIQSIDSYGDEPESIRRYTGENGDDESFGHRRVMNKALVKSTSNVSYSRSITKTLSKIMTMAQDDNEQMEKARANSPTSYVIERFDIGDAVKIQNTDDYFGEGGLRQRKNVGEDGEHKDVSNAEHSILEKVYTNTSTGKVDLPPDGGYGWVVAFCVFLAMFSTWGCNSGFGAFLAYYLNNNTFTNASKYDYALIAGLTVGIAQFLSPISMLCMKIIGLKVTMSFGNAMLIAGFVLASYSTKLWHLYATQGFMTGVSICFICIPATTALPAWFLKKRAVAMGIGLLGTGLGGVVYVLAINKIIETPSLGVKWSLRILAITCSVSVAVAIVLIKQRNPVKPIGLRSWSLIKREIIMMFDFKVVAQPVVPLVAFWFTFALFGYTLIVYSLSSYAVAKGLSQRDGSTLTAILNAAQCVGRPSMGFLGDKYGKANITIVLTAVIAILVFAFWITAHTLVQLIFFSIMLGLCIGVANVMNTVLIVDLVGIDQFLTAWSFVNYSGAPLLLVCEVIAQALVDKENINNPYLHTQIFAGLCFVVALFLILVLREVAVRKAITRLQVENDQKVESFSDEYEDSKSSNEETYQIEERKQKYHTLLGNGWKNYFARMAYPMKV